ncbi:MAG TPA: lytic murein transglycosylase, partial [Rhodanobacteraceae bacterium]|nr:lytic murein transglycosylase [Rhodanobacteraceae bacterium]
MSAAASALLPLLAGAQTTTTTQTTAGAGGTRPEQAELVREVAAATGKSPAELNALLDGAVVKQGIIDAMNRPAESKPWSAYRPIFMNPERIDE